MIFQTRGIFGENLSTSQFILEKKQTKNQSQFHKDSVKIPCMHHVCNKHLSDHAEPSKLTYERLPGPRVFALSPAVRPPQNHGVVFHATESTGLDQVGNSFSNFISYNHLTKSFHLLNVHHILNSLHDRQGETSQTRATLAISLSCDYSVNSRFTHPQHIPKQSSAHPPSSVRQKTPADCEQHLFKTQIEIILFGRELTD